jgi:uncharacterized protein (DUF952 family)
MRSIYHITSNAEAAAARRLGEYTPAAFEADGFIHCSYANQVARVANFKYRGRSDMVLLEIDRAAVPHEVVDENLEGGTELFPHIYGRLPMAAVARIHPFPCGTDGEFELPDSVSV